MNKYITYTARAKMRSLITNSPECTGIKLSAKRTGSFDIIYLNKADVVKDIVICHNPRIVTDAITLSLLKDASVDFSYDDSEFIITRIPYEFSTNS